MLVDECNSSHHQAMGRVGDNLRVTAVSPDDGVIEAVELDSPDHFVVGVQWHPERTFTVSPLSRALFAAFAACRSLAPPFGRNLGRFGMNRRPGSESNAHILAICSRQPV